MQTKEFYKWEGSAALRGVLVRSIHKFDSEIQEKTSGQVIADKKLTIEPE